MSNALRHRIRSTITRFWNHFFPNPDAFDADDFESRDWFKKDYEIVAASLSRRLSFDTAFDVGCAQGFLMEPLLEKGYDVKGIEVSEDALEVVPSSLEGRIAVGDFNEAQGHYDLVCCVEVAEHIAPRRSKELVDCLCRLAKSYIYFTAATPGQVGHGHINCRPHRHWAEWFAEHDWHVDEEKTKQFRDDLSRVQNANWLRENSLILTRNN